MLNGSDYIAVTRLSNLANETLAAEGEGCARVPAASLPWLLEQGLIRLREPRDGFFGELPEAVQVKAHHGEKVDITPPAARRTRKPTATEGGE